jgi:hypothetical protein
MLDNCDIDEYAMLMLDSNFCCIQWDLLLIQQFGHMHMLFNIVFYLNRAVSEVGIHTRQTHCSALCKRRDLKKLIHG